MALIGESSAQLALRDPDVRLMLRVRADEPGAFEELVENYQHRLVAVMHHLIGSAEEAEDLAQEVFLRVYRARTKYRPRSKFSTWLFTIANNLALNALRSRQRKPVVPLNLRDSGPLGVRPAEPRLTRNPGAPVPRTLGPDPNSLRGVPDCTVSHPPTVRPKALSWIPESLSTWVRSLGRRPVLFSA